MGTGLLTRGPARRRARMGLSNWRWGDRIAFGLCWAAGIALCLVAAAIVLFMMVKGLQYLTFTLITSRPEAGIDQSATGGFLDPILGTILLTVIGILIATPVAVAAAVWLVEYGRPSWLAAHGRVRDRDRGRDARHRPRHLRPRPLPAGDLQLDVVHRPGRRRLRTLVPDRGGHDVADRPADGVRSHARGPAVDPLAPARGLLRARQDADRDDPARPAPGGPSEHRHRRRPRDGADRGDTAIVVILLGATLQLQPEGGVPGLDVLKGTGSTLTSYVYNNSPAGEGNASEKAYAAAFVLLAIVVALNFCVDVLARDRRGAGVAAGAR